MSDLQASHPQAGVRGFFAGAAKLGLGLFLASLALAAALGATYWSKMLYDEREAAPYAVPRSWSEDLSASIGMKLEARTKLEDGSLLMLVTLQGSPAWVTDRELRRNNHDTGLLTLIFSDHDGFKVTEVQLPIKKFSNLVNAKDEVIALQAEADRLMDVKTYKRFASMSVQWRLATEQPRAAAAAATPPASRGEDHCAPGLSRAERLRRLATHGEVRETGAGSYGANSRSVVFSTFDNSLVYCH
ncbi:MAG TPA: hypothetical protein PLL48_02040 [Novosphingobium sp.]|nr:hypothetical protein [Novosphingobium sp.]